MDFPKLGLGLGLRRPHHAHVMAERPDVDWFEVISENFMAVDAGWGDPAVKMLETLREDYPLVLHGVSMSLGSADALDLQHLQRLKNLVQRLEPALVTDHPCWSGVDGTFLHDLLPLPYTDAVIDWVVEKVKRVQDFLDRQILLENVSSYLSYSCSEMTEWEFLSEVAKRADCGILLDVNNVYVSAMNHGFEPLDYVAGVPVDRVGQFHLAGHSLHGDFLIDTHDQPVCDAVWQLYAAALRRFGPCATNIERDENIPEFAELQAELNQAARIQSEVRQTASIADRSEQEMAHAGSPTAS